MKVLMLGRFGLSSGGGGGDKIQILNTALELKNLGVQVDFKSTLNCDFSPYDIIHIFQLDWTPETYLYVKKAKTAGKKIVLSPIHHSVSEVTTFDNDYAFGFRRVSKFLFSDQHKRDTVKNFYRSLLDFKKLYPTVLSMFLGLKNMHKYVLQNVDCVLVQTNIEANLLKKTYGVNFNWHLVHNGVSKVFSSAIKYKNNLSFENYILCVGRIEPRKNQLNIIKAFLYLKSKHAYLSNTKLVFIGTKRLSRHLEYVFRFNSILKSHKDILHIESVPYELIPSYYAYAKVGVSASWFETTGLTSLEALFMGTNAVASGAQAREYLGSLASYCNPNSYKSIAEAIKIEFNRPRPVVSDKMIKEYTWKNAAQQTFKVYKSLVEA